MSHQPPAPHSELAYSPAANDDNNDSPGFLPWSRIEAGNALGLHDSDAGYWGASSQIADLAKDDDDPLAHSLEPYGGSSLPNQTASISSSSSSSAGGGASYLPTPNVADFPLPTVADANDQQHAHDQQQPAFETHTAWSVPPLQSFLRSTTQFGPAYPPATAPTSFNGYTFPAPTFGLQLPPVPAAFDRILRLGQNHIALPYAGPGTSESFPSPRDDGHAALETCDDRASLEFYDPSIGRFTLAPTPDPYASYAIGRHGLQEWTPPDDGAAFYGSQMLSASPAPLPPSYVEAALPTADSAYGLGIRVDADWQPASSSSIDGDGRERYPSASSESTSNDLVSADEGESEVDYSSSPAGGSTSSLGGTYYTYPLHPSLAYSHYASPAQFSAFATAAAVASPLPAFILPARLPPSGRPATATNWKENASHMLARVPKGKAIKKDKRVHSCECCRKYKHKCTAMAPARGNGQAEEPCELCVKRGIDCIFSPLNKRGMSKQNPLRVYFENQQRKMHRQLGTAVPAGYLQPTVSTIAAAAVAAGPLMAVSGSLTPDLIATATSDTGEEEPLTATGKVKLSRTASLRKAAPRKASAAARKSAAPYADARRESMP